MARDRGASTRVLADRGNEPGSATSSKASAPQKRANKGPTTATRREDLMNAMSSMDSLAAFHTQEQQADSLDMKELLEAHSVKQAQDLWAAAVSLLQSEVIPALPSGDAAPEALSEVYTLPLCFPHKHLEQQAISSFTLVTEMALAAPPAVREDADLQVPQDLITIVLAVHDYLLAAPTSARELRNASITLLGNWFRYQRPQYQDITPHLCSAAVIMALEEKANQSAIKRLYSMREAFMALDYDHESSVALKSCLLQCVVEPQFLNVLEGRRFLSFLFGLHLNFTEQLHTNIKSTLPHCPKSFISAYGEIYYRAWRGASGAYQTTIENACIQDLIYHALHARKPAFRGPNMPLMLRTMLNDFHEKKQERGVDEMLTKLYEPLLWRALKVANPFVRRNAACLLADVFPLTNPNASRPENEALLEHQVDALQELLTDPHAAVRATGVQAVCRVLCGYWELFPANALSGILTKVVNDLTRFIDLLLAVKGIRDIRFHDIVPLDQLLARLPLETPGNQKRLCKLLLPTYFPMGNTDEVRYDRCVRLVEANREASRIFYSLLPELKGKASDSDVARFVAVLAAGLSSDVKGEGLFDEVDSLMNEMDAANAEAAEDTPMARDTLVGLMEVMVVLLEQLTRRHGQDTLTSRLADRISSLVQFLHTQYGDDEEIQTCTSIIMATLPDVSTKEIVQDRLEELVAAESNTDDLNANVHWLLQNHQLPSLLYLGEQLVANALQVEHVPGVVVRSNQHKRGASKSRSEVDTDLLTVDDTSRSGLGDSILKACLTFAGQQDATPEDRKALLGTAPELLQRIPDVVLGRCSGIKMLPTNVDRELPHMLNTWFQMQLLVGSEVDIWQAFDELTRVLTTGILPALEQLTTAPIPKKASKRSKGASKDAPTTLQEDVLQALAADIIGQAIPAALRLGAVETTSITTAVEAASQVAKVMPAEVLCESLSTLCQELLASTSGTQPHEHDAHGLRLLRLMLCQAHGTSTAFAPVRTLVVRLASVFQRRQLLQTYVATLVDGLLDGMEAAGCIDKTIGVTTTIAAHTVLPLLAASPALLSAFVRALNGMPAVPLRLYNALHLLSFLCSNQPLPLPPRLKQECGSETVCGADIKTNRFSIDLKEGRREQAKVLYAAAKRLRTHLQDSGASSEDADRSTELMHDRVAKAFDAFIAEEQPSTA
ncbi:uncharacterized protein MONBRDRAFT_34252 [Monosiga brevicollis MX1]|uniref:Uncharacterized protein n=1 Tax=Monosiga brevicollis TaxID=81824 RepID=A9VAH6_MONBE|nr:uncharacterized protein MONBRDRAFT_34252 [Monosiga brevicollis MX1]EDQ85542.1 predicted protein [Monosiga brevicollis MX1]|eukprot:XP_001749733.1 hypothetical protein [Monosiga brevicollis MX1]